VSSAELPSQVSAKPRKSTPRTTTTTAGNAWVTTLTTPDTAPNSAFTDNPAVVTDKRLISPTIAIATASAKLSFRNRYTFESSTLPNTWDGGVLEIKIGAGAFTDIVTAGGSFVSGGYNAVVNTGFSNPLAGRAAWGNNNASTYTTTVVNLPAAAAGQTIQLQWRVGTDTSGSGTGQNVDTIVITDGAACQPGTLNTCNDNNACTLDSCNPNPPPGDILTGCDHVPIAEGGSCSDGNACNGSELCDAGGVCQPGTPLVCDDLNACTDDSCNPLSGCVYTNDNTNTCTDNNACTADSCVGGTCVSNFAPSVATFTGGAIAANDSVTPPTTATPYPSTITVPPGIGNIVKVEVLLSGYTHTFPDDIDMLLVGPTGANAVIMSDTGGSTDIAGLNLVLDDAAAAAIPDAGP